MLAFSPNIQQTTVPSYIPDMESYAALDTTFADIRYVAPDEGFYMVEVKSRSENLISGLSWKLFNGSVMRIDIFNAFENCITQKGLSFDKDIQVVVEKIISAFADKEITSYAVDYGRAYKAVILYVSINGKWNFRVRCEATDPDDLLATFSISCCGETIYEGYDDLNDFKEHVDEFFLNLGKAQNEAVEYETSKSESKTNASFIAEIDNWHYGNRISEENNA